MTQQFLQREHFYPPTITAFAHLNVAAVCAAFHELQSQGSAVGAMVLAWRHQPPPADAADQQAVALAPPTFTPEVSNPPLKQVGLCSLLRPMSAQHQRPSDGRPGKR